MFVKGGLKVSNQKREVNEHHKEYQSGLETKHQITSSANEDQLSPSKAIHNSWSLLKTPFFLQSFSTASPHPSLHLLQTAYEEWTDCDRDILHHLKVSLSLSIEEQ